MNKQREIVADVNLLSGLVTWEYIADKHGKKAVEGILSKGLIKLDEEGYLHIADHAFQLSVKFAG